MQVRRTFHSLIIFLTIFAIGSVADASAQTYAGEGAAVKLVLDTAATNAITTAVSATGQLPSDGGNITLTNAGAVIGGGVVSVGDSTVSTSGGLPGGNVNSSQSAASVDTLGVTILGIGISADAVQSTSSCTCGGAVCSGSSTITNLVVAGTPITVTGAPNQFVTVTVPGVADINITINEQITSPGSITVNALHIQVNALVSLVTTDVIVAQAHSGITCTVIPLSSLYSGRAYGVWLQDDLLLASGVSLIVADTGFLPTSGGNLTVSTVGAGLPPILSTGTVTSNTSGGLPGGNVNTSQSDSSVEDLDIIVPLNLPLLSDVRIRAGVLSSQTVCSCSSTTPTCSGNSVLTNLTVSVGAINIPITITGLPNQHLDIDLLNLGLVQLLLDINNRRSVGPGDITQEALRVGVLLAGVTDLRVVVASAHSDIVCGLGPSAANISISGTVFDPNGTALRNAVITVNGPTGEPITARTNVFGNFIFSGLESGNIYVLTTKHRQYQFESQVVSSTEDITGLSIFAMPDQDRQSRRR